MSKKVILITGAAGGIGRALSLGFAKAGYDLALSDLAKQADNLAETVALAEKEGAKVTGIHADVTQQPDTEKLVKQAIADMGTIDILLNCAGVLNAQLLEDVSVEDWQMHVNVNASSVLYMMQSVMPHMRDKKWGRIINIASLAARQGIPTEGAYSAAKASVVTLTRVFSQEVGEHNITVNAICPGIILTQMAMNKLGSPDEIKSWEGITALKRLGQPEDVVGPALFFASDDSEFVTGQALNVCGGLYFH